MMIDGRVSGLLNRTWSRLQTSNSRYEQSRSSEPVLLLRRGGVKVSKVQLATAPLRLPYIIRQIGSSRERWEGGRNKGRRDPGSVLLPGTAAVYDPSRRNKTATGSGPLFISLAGAAGSQSVSAARTCRDSSPADSRLDSGTRSRPRGRVSRSRRRVGAFVTQTRLICPAFTARTLG